MNKILLFAAASVVALSACGASEAGVPAASFSYKFTPFEIPHGVKVLYNQNSNYSGGKINSQNFTSGSFARDDDQAADDFVVPQAHVWRVTAVDVSGVYFNGSGPANTENVIFYKDKNGMPGRAVRNGTFTNLNGAGSGGNFAITLPGKGLRLKPGTYWVSVIINMDFGGYGEWGWDVNSAQHRKQAMWQNPPGGFGYCQTWDTIENCIGFGPDLMFDLKGTSKRI